VYLGAYAWVEDLRPSTARLESVELPAHLAANFAGDTPLNSDPANGGFINAPSLPHARTAAVLRSFIASCKRCGVEPFAWFHDVLSRITAHSITRLSELLPHNWKPMTCPVQA